MNLQTLTGNRVVGCGRGFHHAHARRGGDLRGGRGKNGRSVQARTPRIGPAHRLMRGSDARTRMASRRGKVMLSHGQTSPLRRISFRKSKRRKNFKATSSRSPRISNSARAPSRPPSTTPCQNAKPAEMNRKAFTVLMNGDSHTFDSLECAIQRLAPTCSHCECRIIGHGVEGHGSIFCSAHCAGQNGETALRDRSP